MATMKKAEYGTAIGPKKKPTVSKKPMAPAPKRKSYPIIPDEVTNEGYLNLGPREKTPGGGSSRNGSKISKAKSGGSFPDLNKDGKITRADILKGRGVIKKNGGSMKKKY